MIRAVSFPFLNYSSDSSFYSTLIQFTLVEDPAKSPVHPKHPPASDASSGSSSGSGTGDSRYNADGSYNSDSSSSSSGSGSGGTPDASNFAASTKSVQPKSGHSASLIIAGAAVVSAVAVAAAVIPRRSVRTQDHALKGSVNARINLFSSLAKHAKADRPPRRIGDDDMEMVSPKYNAMV